MAEENYIVATLKPWNIELFHRRISKNPGNWFLLTQPSELTLEKIREINPAYIFFPHWSHIVPQEILDAAECVCFHMTDLPFGRGGSPLQNLIARNCETTAISAIRMTADLDAGPVYLKLPLSLDGLAEEIYMRAADKIARMIEIITKDRPQPQPQSGDAVIFKRRSPEQSRINVDADSLRQVFDQVRMLDADGYPRAFIEAGTLRFEFTRPALRADGIYADVKIIMKDKEPK